MLDRERPSSDASWHDDRLCEMQPRPIVALTRCRLIGGWTSSGPLLSFSMPMQRRVSNRGTSKFHLGACAR
jgi:hypothetical protein